MNRCFAEWYRVANIEPTNEILQKRWQGIEKWASKVDCNGVLELARLFFQDPVNTEYNNAFVDNFYQIDNCFPQTNQLELSVLAGATLVKILESVHKYSKLAAVATLSLSLNKQQIPVPSILEKIKNEFEIITSQLRESACKTMAVQVKIPSNKAITDKFAAAKQNVALWNATEIGDALSSYHTSLSKYLTDTREYLENLFFMQQVYREDSQILWWMVGEWSKDLQKPFKLMDKSEACILIGKELSDCVSVLPGPYSAKAVLNKILSIFPINENEKKIVLTKAVIGLNNYWKQQTLKMYPVEKTKQITPVLSALSLSLDVDGKEEWKPAYKKLTGYDPDKIEISDLQLAFQVYLECLVVKCILECKD